MIWGEDMLFGKPVTRDNAKELVETLNAVGVKNWDDVEIDNVPELTPFLGWSGCPDKESLRYGAIEIRLIGRVVAKADSLENAIDLVYEGGMNHTIPDGAGVMYICSSVPA